MPVTDIIKECDVLIIGGGGAGALAAVEASKHANLKIVIVSKGPIGKSGLTPTANGGTAFHDTAQGTLEEIVTAGCFLNDQTLVHTMAQEALKILDKLKDFGVKSVPIRAVSRCVLPSELLPTLRKRIVQAENVVLLEDVLISGLINGEKGESGERAEGRAGHIAGATALNLSTGDFFIIKAKAVVVATGGLVGEMYLHTSNNPFGISTDSSGTGHAMAYRAGAEMIDLEMIQFVPVPGDPACLNIRYFPEFWEGPYFNRHGAVVEDNVAAYSGKTYSYHFVRKIHREIQNGNGPICVDHRDTPRVQSKLKIGGWALRRKLFSKLNIDPHDHKVEIIIGSHFGMGGIKVDESMETTVPGLFAAGEVMGGVHGGLRLPGASFTQMIVFGVLAGRHAANHALAKKDFNDFSNAEIEDEKERIFRFMRPKNDTCCLAEIKKRLQKTMQANVFVLRDRPGLETAIAQLADIRKDVPRIAVPDNKRFNLEWARSIEFDLMLQIAEVIVRSALIREESRGFHFRKDFPEQNDKDWLKHVVAQQSLDSPSFYTRPVSLKYLKPEVKK